MLMFLSFSIIVILIILLIVGLTYIINFNTFEYEKHSVYECGFEPFGDTRSFFDIHFYTIGLLFIIFDLEIVFLIPYIINFEQTSFIGLLNFFVFMLILLIGFYYE
jgi:NADH-quinone oxidoreductase subunit A